MACGVTSLAPGASTNCTADYILTQMDIDAGHRANSATACGVPPAGADGRDTDTTDTPLTRVTAIDLEKSATLDMTVVDPDERVDLGDKIVDGFTITNTGNVTLTSVDLLDALVGNSTAVACGVGTLAPGASTNCTADYFITQPDIDAGTVHNSATACGTPPTGADVCDTDTTDTPLPRIPVLSILKDTHGSNGDWGDGVFVVINENVEWRYIVTNTGNVTLTNVTVTDVEVSNPDTSMDNSPDIDCGGGTNIIASMAPGATVTCDAGPVTNTVAIGTTYQNIGTASTTFGTTTVTDDDPSSYTSRPFGMLMTNTQLCSLPNDEFRLLFTPDQGRGYKLNASNPGQFYYNMFYVGAGDETVNFNTPISMGNSGQYADPYVCRCGLHDQDGKWG